MSKYTRFHDGAEYEPTDSEDEYSERDRARLSNVRKRNEAFSDSEEEVLGVGADDDSEDEDSDGSDMAASDVEGQGDDDAESGMPNAKAWGKDKRDYYHTDYVDQDYGGMQSGKDAANAEFEEQEARNLQLELAKQLDDDDFVLDIPKPDITKQLEETSEEVVKADISSMSNRQKLQLLEKESPEFFGLLEDYKDKTTFVVKVLDPILKLNIESSEALEFLYMYKELILNYTTNVLMYLLLKSQRVNTQTHPVIKRLYQYRQLLVQVESVYNEVIAPQIDDLKSYFANKYVKKTSDLENAVKASMQKKVKKDVQLKSLKKLKKVKDEEIVLQSDDDFNFDNAENSMDEDDAGKEKLDSETEDRRKITYEMAKNKGLMPARKKEQRNPRVKHRMKFRKAQIRRKGAVRDVRTETRRYGGEVSGIKASVTKSIKFK